MFRKIENAQTSDTPFLSYGFNSSDSKYQKNFHDEDTLVDLIITKSGLFDQNSTLRTLTDMQANTVEFQLHYEYEKNQELFVEALCKFLNSASRNDLGLKFEMKETMRYLRHNPTLTTDRNHLKDLIADIKQAPTQPLNQEILQGPRWDEGKAICFGRF